MIAATLACTFASAAVNELSAQPRTDFRPDETVLLYGEKLVDNTDPVVAKKVTSAGFTMEESNGLTGPEEINESGNIGNINVNARFDLYFPKKPNGQMVIVCPGGGYSIVSSYNEGVYVAEWLAERGITAAIVKYRLPNGHSEIPRNDADEALRVMKARADEFGVDPEKIGVSGTSAGGYLAGSVGVLSENKPAFMILFYPVISADLDIRHKGTFVQLMGDKDANSPKAMAFSLEKHVDSTTPPTLLFHSDDDKVVPAVNSAIFYQRLKENGVKASLHIYPSGGHGWGINPKFRYYDDWQKSVLDWLSTL